MSEDMPDRSLLREVLTLALDEVRRAHKDYLGTPHLFIALTRLEGGCTQDALRSLGRSPEQVSGAIRQAIGSGKARSDIQIALTRRCKEVLQNAERNASNAHSTLVDERAIAQAVLSEQDGVTHKLLTKRGISPSRLIELILASQAQAVLERVPSADANREAVVDDLLSSLDQKGLPIELLIGSFDDSQLLSSMVSSDEMLDWSLLREVLTLALDEVRRAHKDYLGAPHLFIALTRLEGSRTQDALRSLGRSPEQVSGAIRQAIGSGKARSDTQITLTRRCKEILQNAERNAIDAHSTSIDERAIAQAVLSEQDGVTHELLTKLRINPSRLIELILAGM